MEIQHFSHEEHPLMFVEEFKNDGEIKVIVCSGCDKSLYAPAYKCSPCNFFLHKSCTELPPEIQHPPVHPNHTLVLQATSKYMICDVCRRDCERCFFYPAAQVCRICQLLAHTSCTRRPRSIKIISGRHMLTLIHSLGKVIKEHDPVFCNFCYKKVNLKYAAYYCQQCQFVAHLDCAVEISIGLPSDTIDSSIEEEEGILFEEAEEGEELQHFDHEHKLIISRNEVEVHDHKLCEGCMQSIISAPFYSCDQCNYFLHSTCARLPLKKRYPFHQHVLILTASKYVDDLVFCNACQLLSNGFVYKCDECAFSLDIRCCSIPIKIFKHERHQHSLPCYKFS